MLVSLGGWSEVCVARWVVFIIKYICKALDRSATKACLCLMLVLLGGWSDSLCLMLVLLGGWFVVCVARWLVCV